MTRVSLPVSAMTLKVCSCMELGACPSNSRCFLGWNRSSTFALARDANGERMPDQITYGSGSVQGVVANEQIRLGSLSANITEGILLVAESALRLGEDTVFEGILGLGMPKKSVASDTGSYDSSD